MRYHLGQSVVHRVNTTQNAQICIVRYMRDILNTASKPDVHQLRRGRLTDILDDWLLGFGSRIWQFLALVHSQQMFFDNRCCFFSASDVLC